MSGLEPQQISWWSVHEFVLPKLEKVGAWPLLGSPAWCLLDDHDPTKLAALLEAASLWALRIECAQETRRELAVAS